MSPNANLQAAAAEALTDLLFELGKDLMKRGDNYRAAKWLEKAHSVLTCQEADQLSTDSDDLKLSILHYLVRASLQVGNETYLEKARQTICLLENEYEGKMVVILLRLDMIAAEPSFDAERYFDALHRVIRMVHMTSANYKTYDSSDCWVHTVSYKELKTRRIMSRIHKLRVKDARLAGRALDDLLTLRLFSERNLGWIEKTLIMRIWLISQDVGDNTDDRNRLGNLLATFVDTLNQSLSIPATNAAQTLLWKTADNSFKQSLYDITGSWCTLLLQPAFENAGESNRAKILRRMIACAMAKHDTVKARQTFNQMPQSIRDAPLTRFLLFKVALKDRDTTLASECLQIISSKASEDATLVYACVLEAQKSGDRRQAITALQHVTTAFDYNAPHGVHLPALLRCTARMLMVSLGSETEDSDNAKAEFCHLFIGAATQAVNERSNQRQQGNQHQFTDHELRWFAGYSYNMAYAKYGEWASDHVNMLLEACNTFIRLLLDQTHDQTVIDDLGRRATVCSALSVQLLVKLARLQGDKTAQLQKYASVRKRVQTVRDVIGSVLNKHTASDSHEHMSKIRAKLLISDFEAAIQLKVWDGLRKVIDDCNHLHDPKIYASLADMLLAAEVPQPVIYSALEQITDALSTLSTDPDSTTPTIARWLRILYHLSTTTTNPCFTNKDATNAILTRALALADRARPIPTTISTPNNDTTNATAYPEEELEYLSTTTFNRAVDAFCAGDEGNCERLAGLAVSLAQRMADGGALVDVLGRRLGSLKCEGEGGMRSGR